VKHRPGDLRHFNVILASSWARHVAPQACYWTRDQERARWGDLPSPFAPIEKGAGGATAAVTALYEDTFREACVMEWTLNLAGMELDDRLRAIGPAAAARSI
jgi:hypothetical protein